MKNYTFILLVCFFCMNSLNGQPYKSIFANDSTEWHVFECTGCVGGTTWYHTNSDTIIDSKLYHKIYSTRKQDADDPITFEEDNCVFINEDTLTGKYMLLTYDEGKKIEYPIMDLSLENGDSFNIIKFYDNLETETIFVDSVYYENNLKIISFDKYQCYPKKIKFVEGIGTSNGFYWGEPGTAPNYYSLLCKFENGEKTYSSDLDYGDCFRHSGAVEENPLDKIIDVYPNPSCSIINIRISDPKASVYMYKVINIFGNIVAEGIISNSEQPVQLEQNGVYFVQATSNGLSALRKIIINTK